MKEDCDRLLDNYSLLPHPLSSFDCNSVLYRINEKPLSFTANTTMYCQVSQAFEQSIQINATPSVVESCITDLNLMHRWLNPVLRCEPVGEAWSTDIGSQSRFIIQIPLFEPTLKSVVVERQPGVVVWEFQGFFQGRDRWECQPFKQGTCLLNRFEFDIPNLLVSWGFQTFAASLTQKDMQAQLRRLKQVAESVISNQ